VPEGSRGAAAGLKHPTKCGVGAPFGSPDSRSGSGSDKQVQLDLNSDTSFHFIANYSVEQSRSRMVALLFGKMSKCLSFCVVLISKQLEKEI
jgi:hypothetical protein